MNNIENDMNLREAVNRREQHLSPIDDELNERLMQRMVNLPAEKPRYRLKVSFAAAIAAAACMLLLAMTTPERLAAHQQEIKEKGAQLAAYIQQRQIQPIIEENNEY